MKRVLDETIYVYSKVGANDPCYKTDDPLINVCSFALEPTDSCFNQKKSTFILRLSLSIRNTGECF